jgi:hypothetical protein
MVLKRCSQLAPPHSDTDLKNENAQIRITITDRNGALARSEAVVWLACLMNIEKQRYVSGHRCPYLRRPSGPSEHQRRKKCQIETDDRDLNRRS